MKSTIFSSANGPVFKKLGTVTKELQGEKQMELAQNISDNEMNNVDTCGNASGRQCYLKNITKHCVLDERIPKTGSSSDHFTGMKIQQLFIFLMPVSP